MTCIFIPGEKGKFGAVLCVDRAVDLRIQVGRKLVLFEDSEQWGPSLINQRGEILVKQPGERSPFWDAYHAWVRQGKRVADGVCLWEEQPPVEVVMQRQGRWWKLISGDPLASKTKVIRLDEAGDVLREGK